MKFLFIAPRYHTNQIPYVRTLLKNNHQVEFFVQYVGQSEDHSLISPKIVGYNLFFAFIKKFKRIDKRDIFKFERLYGFPSLLRYNRMIKTYSPDIVIIRDRTFFSLVTFLICKRLKINTILYQQTPMHKIINGEKTKNFNSHIKSLIYKKIVSPVKITPIKGESSVDFCTSKKVYYLPFIAESISIKSKKYKPKDSAVKIITIGKFVARKRHLLLLDAIESLLKSYKIDLTIIGEVSTKHHEYEYKKVIEHIYIRDLTNVVTILTNLDYEEVKNEYLKHDLFVLPSVNEQFGVSVLEAMSHDLPVICSDSAGSKEYIVEGLNGFIFQSDNLYDLEKKITEIISDNSKLWFMVNANLDLVKRKYSPNLYYNKLMKLIQDNYSL